MNEWIWTGEGEVDVRTYEANGIRGERVHGLELELELELELKILATGVS